MGSELVFFQRFFVFSGEEDEDDPASRGSTQTCPEFVIRIIPIIKFKIT
jgi:hypothetical protein